MHGKVFGRKLYYFIKRMLHVRRMLAGKAGYNVHVYIVKAHVPRHVERGYNVRAFMAAAYQFKRCVVHCLRIYGKPAHAVFFQHTQLFFCYRIRPACFNGEFPIESCVCFKRVGNKAVQLIRRKHRWRAAAYVHCAYFAARLLQYGGAKRYVLLQRGKIGRHVRLFSAHLGGKAAIQAARCAERYTYVYIRILFRLAVKNWLLHGVYCLCQGKLLFAHVKVLLHHSYRFRFAVAHAQLPQQPRGPYARKRAPRRHEAVYVCHRPERRYFHRALFAPLYFKRVRPLRYNAVPFVNGHAFFRVHLRACMPLGTAALKRNANVRRGILRLRYFLFCQK